MTRQQKDPTVEWPRLPLTDWSGTRDTLHMWTQIVGKIRLAHAPLLNHWWQVALYVSARGLTTSAIPCGSKTFDCEFDFVDHQLHLRVSDGGARDVALEPKPVALFYAETMNALDELGIATSIHASPNEVEPAIPFPEDYRHAEYDRAAVELFWRQLAQADRVIGQFRASFVGKVSPVHFFWGSMDLACTRFSGRLAPPHPGGVPHCPDWVMRESYSHELASCGFWPGGGAEGAFYAYAYPAPPGFGDSQVRPESAFYSQEHGEFLLPYEAVAGATDPDQVLMDFLTSTYEAAAELARWDRPALEIDPHRYGPARF